MERNLLSQRYTDEQDGDDRLKNENLTLSIKGSVNVIFLHVMSLFYPSSYGRKKRF